MTFRPDDWPRVKAVFDAALEVDDAARAAFVAASCGDDAELRRQVETLLAEHLRAGGFLDTPPHDVVSSPPDVEWIGRTIGTYRVTTKLGAGGMGEVYAAHDTNLERPVALKLLPAAVAADADRLRRFRAEARAASSLNHPHILVIHDFGDVAGRPFMVTELVEGETLRQRLQRGPLTVREAVDIAMQVASALAAAHARGIVHRDIKPENVMVRPDGYVKVLDFGLAKLLPADPSEAASVLMTIPGTVMGTPRYMSPEQSRGRDLDARSDVWSLGAVLYEMVTGHAAFDGSSTADVMAAILGHDPPPLASAALAVPASLDRIVLKSLRKDREERYETASALHAELRTVSLELDVKTHRDQTPAGNVLPADLTPLIGRDVELAQLTQLLRDDGVRLVTLTGAGGTGKTRLAIAAAQRLFSDFADGVFFVALGAVLDPALVAPTIAQALEVTEGPGESPAVALQRHVARREVLIVIDNFEQVRDAAHVLTELLAGAPRLSVLTTSQAALRVRGEREFPVAPLPVPSARDSMEAVRSNPAVALLVSRAQDVNAAFELTGKNAHALVEICRRLEGLPLAIELTASRLKVLSPEAVLRKLDEPLTFLTAGRRDLPPRQQTMRNAIEWSYAQLTSSEQALFRRLAVFRGGCTAEAVEAICALDAGPDQDILERFASIVDKSLVRGGDDHTGEPRFSMLTTIHSFADDLLDRSEATELRRRHALYFMTLIERVEPELLSGSGATWLRRLDQDLHNIRAALNWCADTGQRLIGLTLAGALLPFWLRRGHISEGRSYLSRLLDDHDSDEPPRVKALYAAGVLAEAQGGFLEARRYLEQNLDAHRRRRDAWGIGNALNNLGVICLRLKEYGAARALYRESMEVWNTLGNRPAIALSLQNLGNIARLEKHFDAARTLYDESLAEFRAMQDELGVAKCFNLLSDLAREEGTLDRARQLGEASLEIFMKLTEHREVAVCLADLGRIEHDSHNPGEAYSLYQESLLIFRELEDALGMAQMLEALAGLAATEDRPAEAIRIAATAAGLRKAAGAPPSTDELSQIDGWLQPARHAVGNARAAELWREGEALSLEDAVALTERSRLS